MSRGGIIGLILAAIMIGVFVFLGSDIKDIKLPSSGGVLKEVKFSVVRYNGEAVSVQLIVSGSGKLESRHRIPEEKVGIAYYKNANLVQRIQACDSYRYLPSEDGFTCEVVTEQIRVK